MEVRGTNLIGYSDSALGNRSFQAIDPTTGSLLSTPFFQATANETIQAIESSHTAFLSGWHNDVLLRATLLETCAKWVETHAKELMHWYCLESGLSEARANAELQRSCFQMRSYATSVRSGYALGLKISPATTTTPDIRKMQVPLGPVVVFGASNFPFAYSVLGGDVASALAAGCPVIVKGHPMHPHTGELSARILREAAQSLDLPEGIISYLHAEDYSVGEQLVSHPLVAAVGFTGSIRGGEALLRLAQARKIPIPVFAEMGSTNPIVVTSTALHENGTAIAREIVASIALSAGQFCTSPGLLLVVSGPETLAFAAALRDHLSQVELQAMLHPGIFMQYVHQVEKQLPGATVLFNGERAANFIQPTLFQVNGSQFLREEIRQEEVFGSFAQLIVCQNEQELEKCLAILPGQLTASLYCGKQEIPSGLMESLQRFAGRVILNGVPTGVAVTHAMQHGGPYPSSSAPSTTAVGADAVLRFSRPVSFQNVPDHLLPEPLKSHNPQHFLRFVNGLYTDNAC